MEIQFAATTKTLNFISDPEMTQVILDIMEEIDRLVLVRAHRSMIYLSMSTLEGLLANVLRDNRTKAKALPSYPVDDKGKPKRIGDLSLQNELLLAKDLKFIDDKFYDTFDKFRDLRNYMHPGIEVKKKEELNLGLGQIALGLMNHTISKLEKIRFIDEKIWNVVSGIPFYDSTQKKIEFRIVNLPTHSFMVTSEFLGSDLNIEFDLRLGAERILNFVFNYKNEDEFQMIRFETRSNEFSGLLHCGQKYGWHLVDGHNETWQIKTVEPNKVSIQLRNGLLSMVLNGAEVLKGKSILVDKNTPIGFFNEVNNVTISELSIKIL